MPSPRYSHRPYRGAPDLDAMLALVAMRPARQISTYPSIVDLQELCGTPAARSVIRLWEDRAGALLGFTLLQGTSFAFEVSPRAVFDELAGQMTAWAIDSLSAAPPSGAPPILVTSARYDDAARIAFLELRNFSAQPVRTLHFTRSLREPIPAPVLPEGFIIRPIAGEAEAEAWVALHRAAHGTEWMTVDYRLAMMRTPDYDPQLDLVAVAPNGRLAAYTVCFFSEQENRLCTRKVGYTDPIATHPAFQGRGLARALLFEGFARLKACGLDSAEVSMSGSNNAMIRAAESAGYRRFSSTIFYSRAISPASR